MKEKKNPASPRHRLIPVWRTELDRQGLARALLLLAMHLDERDREAHTKQQNPAEEAAGQKGDGHDEQK
jgi:hypothetical protein